MYLVSVLTTAFNREKYIEDAIKSVLNSTFKNFELVIVDDQSTDATLEIAREYERQDDRVRVHVNEENLGDYPNRNRAASLAEGKYIKYLDADDLIYPHGLEAMVRSIEQFPDAAFGLGRPPSYTVPYPTQISPSELFREHFFEGVRWHNSPLSAIIRREAFEAVGGFSGRPYVGDMEMWLNLGARYPAVKLMGGFGFWRKHEAQETNYRKTNEELARDTILRHLVQKEALRDSECPLPDSEKEAAMDIIRHRLAREVFWRFRQGKFGVAREIYKQSGFNLSDFLKVLPSPDKY